MILEDNIILSFGKYKGLTFKEIRTKDYSYSLWLKENWYKFTTSHKKKEEKESNFKPVETIIKGNYICHLCLQRVKQRDECRFCEPCVTHNSNLIPKIVIMRNKKKQNNGNTRK